MGNHLEDTPYPSGDGVQPQPAQQPGGAAGGVPYEKPIDNADFISGRVSRKDRRKMDSAPLESDAFLGPADDHATKDIPTFHAGQNAHPAEQPTEAVSNPYGDPAAGAAGSVPGGAGMAPETQPGVPQSQTGYYDPATGLPTQPMTANMGDPNFGAGGYADPLTSTAQQPPVQFQPQAFPGGAGQPGHPDNDSEDDDDEKRSPWVLILSIALVAALLVIAGVIVWAVSSKDEPQDEPSQPIETSPVEESSEPTTTQDMNNSVVEPDEPEQTEQMNVPPTQAPQKPQPAPKPQPTPKPKPAPNPQPAPSTPAQPQGPSQDPGNPDSNGGDSGNP